MNSTAPLPKFPLLICLAGIVAAAVPCRVIHRGFWNYGFQGASSDTRGVRIDEIEPGTPAAAIKPQEPIVAVNGDSEAIYDLHRAWRKAPVGSEVEFTVLRGDPPADVKVPILRVPDPIAGFIYWNWQLVSGAAFLVTGLLVATMGRISRVRIAVGLLVIAIALAVAALAAPLGFSRWATLWIVVSQRIAWGAASEFPLWCWQAVTTLAASAALAA